MVFSNLNANEKDAFFSLLDEYFESRPHLRPQEGAANAAGDAVKRALANNPETTSKLVSAGLKTVPKSSPYAAVAHAPQTNSVMNRVAAMHLATKTDTSIPLPHAPPTPVRKISGNEPPSGLVATQSIGGINTASTKSMLGSVLNRSPNNTPIPVKRTPPPVVRREPTPEPQGEWAEAQYDYASADPGDLDIKAGDRILVTERSSVDWWTGELNGKSGIFPASYVTVL